MRNRTILFVALLFAVSASADPLTFSGSVRLRAENWSFFEPPPPSDPDYTFLGALFRVSAAQRVNERVDWQLELAAPALLNLPDGAVSPTHGQLGFGGSYHAANGGDENAASLFPKQAFVRLRWTNDTLRLGRFEFVEGTEGTPKNPTLAALKSGRVAHRLIGNFGFSHVGRSVDGVQYVHDRENLNVTAVAFRPTVGAFDVDGLDQVDGVDVLYGALTYSRPNADERLFVIAYRDTRDVMKTDNRPAPVRTIDRDDVRVITIGGHYLALFGNADVLLWGAWQTGDWGVQSHRAGAIDVEAGYHFGGAMKPALRVGYFQSTGDSDPSDDEHETFFQVLPTPRIYARFPFYNAMNSTDAFLQFSIKPSPKVTLTSEAHLLRLTESADLWYAGGGAFQDETFGFAGRASRGHDELARVFDASVDYAFSPEMTFTLYGGFADGGEVVSSLFDDESARYLYLELTRRF